MNFEYLDPQDGVTIEILHTDINRYPNFKGTVRECQLVRKIGVINLMENQAHTY
jgi:hypothetical protein